MNRRSFLASLFGAAALILDPDRELWLPGKKLISIPKAPEIVTTGWAGSTLKVGDIVTFDGVYKVHPKRRQLDSGGGLEQFIITKGHFGGGIAFERLPMLSIKPTKDVLFLDPNV